MSEAVLDIEIQDPRRLNSRRPQVVRTRLNRPGSHRAGVVDVEEICLHLKSLDSACIEPLRHSEILRKLRRQAKAADGLGPYRECRNGPAAGQAHRPRLYVPASILDAARNKHVAGKHIGHRPSRKPFPRVIGGADIRVRIDVPLSWNWDIAV